MQEITDFLTTNINYIILTINTILLFGMSLFSFYFFKKNRHFTNKEFENLKYDLYQESEKFRLSFEKSPLGKAIVSPDGKILEANEKLCNLLGYTEKELINMHFDEITHDDDIEEDCNNFKKILNNTISYYKLEKRYITKYNKIIWTELTVSAIKDDSGKLICVLGNVENITEKRKNQLLLKQKNEIINLYNSEFEKMMYALSHDIKDPVRKILSYSELLKNKYSQELNENGNKYIDYIIFGAEKIRKLSIDILSILKLGIETELFNGEIDLNEVIKDTIKLYDDYIKEKNINIIKKKEFPKMNINRSLIENIFQNLISNAIKFSSSYKDSYICLDYEENKNHVIFTFKDNGIGINKNKYDKIFEPFSRLNSHEEYSGTGIGLTLCKKIVNMMNGEIWLDSEIGEGTTFFVKIPIEYFVK